MFFAKLHPLLVHFPMALLASGALFEIFGKLQKEESVVAAGKFNVRFGFWSAIPTIIVGVLGGLSLNLKPEVSSFLVLHIMYAFLTLGLFAVIIFLNRFLENPWVKVVYYLLLASGLFSILATGFYGGEMVHRFGLPGGAAP
ncbi:MAG: DUF2231 domain-containing protein [Nitrospinales bacterium]